MKERQYFLYHAPNRTGLIKCYQNTVAMWYLLDNSKQTGSEIQTNWQYRQQKKENCAESNDLCVNNELSLFMNFCIQHHFEFNAVACGNSSRTRTIVELKCDSSTDCFLRKKCYVSMLERGIREFYIICEARIKCKPIASVSVNTKSNLCCFSLFNKMLVECFLVYRIIMLVRRLPSRF